MTMVVKVKWHSMRVRASEQAGAAKGLFEAAEHVLEVSQRLVPIGPTGDLSRSGGTDVDKAALKASVYYDTVYACRQHEELTWHHTRPGAQAKYLEQPANTEEAKCHSLIAAAIKGSFGG